MIKTSIPSPLVKGGKATYKDFILVDNLIENYMDFLQIKVEEYFYGRKEIYIYECDKTKYRFYYPFGMEGDHKFYEKLEEFDWYYMPWKWEHDIVKNILSGNEKILEVGSGGLGFIEQIEKSGFDITGLEFNKKSICKAKEMQLQVYDESIQEHSAKNNEEYDLICSFQVLEHISEVHSFIQSQIDCLKVGGRLIISVPNNDSFIKLNGGGVLNKPPHHMGLWNKKSLKNLTRVFNIKLERIAYEPLQDYHFDWYIDSVIQNHSTNNYLKRLLFKIFFSVNKSKSFLKKVKRIVHGHTILAIYTKY